MSNKSIFRSSLFKGKFGIVTGGGSGLGFAIASELLSLGANVLICGRTVDRLEAAVKSLKGNGNCGQVDYHRCNVRSAKEIEELVEYALNECPVRNGRIDFLVNNAGGQFVSPLADISEKGFKAVVETNLFSMFYLSREVYNRAMKPSGEGGSIVNITVANNNGFPMMGHSGAARAGVENLMKTMSLEWIDSGVRVNNVAPGIIFTESGFENYGAMGDLFLDTLLPSIPANRCGTPEETSAMVVFLLSEAASYITGTSISVDGALNLVGLPLRPSMMESNEDSDEDENESDTKNEFGESNEGGEKGKKKTKDKLPVYGTLPRKAKL